jgi:hypothetical protein
VKGGLAWEMLLEGLHKRYARDRVAHVDRCHPEVKAVQTLPGGKFVGIRPKWGPVDFLGVLAGGRAVAFDAKETAAPTFALANLAPHQARDLRRYHELGAVAGVALRCAQGCFWLSWDVLAPALPAGTVDPARVGRRFELGWHPSGRDPVPVGDGWLAAVSAPVPA